MVQEAEGIQVGEVDTEEGVEDLEDMVAETAGPDLGTEVKEAQAEVEEVVTRVEEKEEVRDLVIEREGMKVGSEIIKVDSSRMFQSYVSSDLLQTLQKNMILYHYFHHSKSYS